MQEKVLAPSVGLSCIMIYKLSPSKAGMLLPPNKYTWQLPVPQALE